MLWHLFIASLWSPAGKGLTSWLLFVMLNCVFVTFPCGILGQVWYLIVSILDLCRLPYFHVFDFVFNPIDFHVIFHCVRKFIPFHLSNMGESFQNLFLNSGFWGWHSLESQPQNDELGRLLCLAHQSREEYCFFSYICPSNIAEDPRGTGGDSGLL